MPVNHSGSRPPLRSGITRALAHRRGLSLVWARRRLPPELGRRSLPLICARPDSGGHRGLSSEEIGSSIQHLASIADFQQTLIFTIDPLLRIDVTVVQV